MYVSVVVCKRAAQNMQLTSGKSTQRPPIGRTRQEKQAKALLLGSPKLPKMMITSRKRDLRLLAGFLAVYAVLKYHLSKLGKDLEATLPKLILRLIKTLQLVSQRSNVTIELCNSPLTKRSSATVLKSYSYACMLSVWSAQNALSESLPPNPII